MVELYAQKEKVLSAYIKCWGRIDNLEDIEVVGNHSYKFNCLLTAVDSYFKILCSLRKECPIAAKQIWQYLATDVYDIDVHGIMSDVTNFSNTIKKIFIKKISQADTSAKKPALKQKNTNSVNTPAKRSKKQAGKEN